jgi:hypothetical protein
MYRYTNIPFAGIIVNKRYDFIGPLYEDGELQLNSYGQPIVKYYRNYIFNTIVNGIAQFGEPEETEEGVDWEFNIPFEVAKLLTYDLSDKEVQTDTEEEDEEHGGKKSKKSKKTKSKKTKSKKTKSKNKKRFTRRI